MSLGDDQGANFSQVFPGDAQGAASLDSLFTVKDKKISQMLVQLAVRPGEEKALLGEGHQQPVNSFDILNIRLAEKE
jgi:hypothetical protein